MSTFIGTQDDDTLPGSPGSDTVIGRGGADTISGGDGDDVLYGADGSSGVDVVGDLADVIHGDNGDDLIRGNAGDDQLFGDAGNDNLRGDSGNDLIDGGDGHDVAVYRFDEGTAPSGVNFSLASVASTATPVQISDGRGGFDTVVRIEAFAVLGSTVNDRIIGSQLEDQITGNLGNDLVIGNAGDDAYLYYVNGGSGSITLTDGYDTIINNDATGFDTLAFVRASGGSPGVPVNFATLVRSGNDLRIDIRASGSPGASIVGGITIKDLFTTNPAAQIDRIEFDNGHADVTLDTSAGTVTITTVRDPNPMTGDPGGTSSQVYSSLGGTISGTANNDTLIGTAGNDAIIGLEGNDTLRGGAGSDTLEGGLGYDTLEGGAGDDLLDGGPGVDASGQPYFDIADYRSAGSLVNVNLSTGVAVSATEGTDALISIDGVYGSVFADTMTGSLGHDGLWGYGGNDVLYGAGGGDYLAGGDGNDTLYGQDGDDELDGGLGADHLDGGPGTDTLNFWDTTFAYSGGAVVDLQAGTSVYQGSTDTLASIENVQGTEYADLLRGDAGPNALQGLNGGDVLVGRGGDDVIDGGDGYDVAGYRFDEGGFPTGVVFDLSTVGSPMTGTFVADGLGSNDWVFNVEKLAVLGSTAGDTILGSDFDDQIAGNLGTDELSGNGGDDVYLYFANNVNSSDPTIWLTDGDDLIRNNDAAGYDTLAFVPAEGGEAGVSIDNVYTHREGHDLVLDIQAGTDWDDPPADARMGSVTIKDFYTNDPTKQVDRIDFQDAYALVQLRADAVVQAQIFDSADQLVQNALAGVSGGHDVLTGTDGRDILDGGEGDDFLDGSDGTPVAGDDQDMAYFTGDVADYSFTVNADGSITVVDSFVGRDGTDTVVNVEFGRFADGIFAASDLWVPPNLPPVGAPTAVLPAGTEDTAYIVDPAALLLGFSDPEGGPLNAGSLVATNGTVEAYMPGGNFQYWIFRPDANFNGTVTLSYEVADDDGNGVDATQSFVVVPVNDAPVAVDDTYTLLRNQTITFNVLANDTDVDIARGESQTLSLVNGSVTPDPALKGLLSVDYASGLVTYTSPGTWSGTLSFSYVVSDGAASDPGVFTINVSNEIYGTDGANIINNTYVPPTTSGVDVIYALGGDDTVDAKAGDDTVYGGDGNDTITGGTGADLLYGNDGNDVFVVGGADLDGDRIEGGAGSTDTLRLSANTTVSAAFTATGVEILDLNFRTLTANIATLDLSGFSVLARPGQIQGTAGTNTIIGTGGNDQIAGLDGADVLNGGLGNDSFVVQKLELSGDRIDGGAGTDTLVFNGPVTLSSSFSATSVEWLDMGFNRLTVSTTEKVDLSGFTSVFSGALGFGGSTMAIAGDTQPNTIVGSRFSDAINGSAGNDVLDGAGGNDTLFGGTGTDVLTGGTGSDTFVFDRAPNAATNWDSVMDFDAGADKIFLDKGIFDAVYRNGTTALDATEFRMNVGGVAVDANDFILFDTRNGYLYYDADGSGTRYDGVLFAELRGGYLGMLDNTDFLVGTPPAGP
jgi:Ca2+-binding RTX toxin-like protein